MAVGAALGASSLISGYMGSQAAGKAADIQAGAARRSGDIQMQMFEQGREDLAPWREAGGEAIGGLRDIYGLGGEGGRERALESFQAGPAYQWQLDEASRASDAAAAAGGRFSSGSQKMALQDLAQNRANVEFGSYTSGLQNLASMGQGSAGQSAQLGLKTGQGVGQSYMQAGQAQAAGTINQANFLSSMIGEGADLYGLQQGGYFNKGAGGLSQFARDQSPQEQIYRMPAGIA